MLGQGRHLHWSDQAAVGKALSLNCYNDSTILHKAKYVIKIFACVYVVCTYKVVYDKDVSCVCLCACVCRVCVCVCVCTCVCVRVPFKC